MIDIDDIYEACRAVSSHDQISFRINMLMWREAFRFTRQIVLGPGTLYINGFARGMVKEVVIEQMRRDYDAARKLEVSIPLSHQEFADAFAKLNAVTIKQHNDLHMLRTDKVRIKAQWKDEARQRHGRNWKR